MAGERPPLEDSYPVQFTRLIRNCWHQDPLRRPTFQQIHNYLLWVREEELEAQRIQKEERPQKKIERRITRALSRLDTIGVDSLTKQDSLAEIFKKFRDPEFGVPVGDKTFFFKTFKNVFKGTDAVEWVMETYGVKKDKAREICGKLLRFKYFSHCSSDMIPFTGNSGFCKLFLIPEQKLASIDL